MATITEVLQIALEHQTAGRLAQAEQLYRQVLQTDPRNADALHLLGVIADHVGQHELAIQYISQAIRFYGSHAPFHVNLGEAYRKLRKNDQAIQCYQQALRLDPNSVEAHHNSGAAYQNEARLDEALAAYGRAIELNPRFVDAHFNRAQVWLAMGDYARGWPEYEWRWQKSDYTRQALPKPFWDGTELAGRALLVQCEQGLGDTLQFIRYLRLFESQGDKVFVAVQQPLVALLSCSGFDGLFAPGTLLPHFDVHTSLLSLPHLFKTRPDSIPAQIPYLKPRLDLVESWRTRLSAVSGFKIGISWQGNPKSPHEPGRSIPLAAFEPLAMPGVRLISLQKAFGLEQIPQVADRFSVLDFSEQLDETSGPFMDTAALMTQLDLVVTSDTVTAHLAGALGVPVWVGLPFPTDWRWQYGRSDCPWYPTMRLFRQPQRNDWSSVIAQMKSALSV
jgi:Tfp pilus assembly protein PilF